MLCPNNDCANFVVCDENISSLVICWKTRYEKRKISERHFLADETERRTESLPKLNKVHRILFGIPDFNFVRNIPRHVRTLQVRESLKVPFWIIPHRSSKLLRVSPVKFKISSSDREFLLSKSMQLWFNLDAMSRISVDNYIKPEGLKSDVVRVGEICSTAWL